jgi:fluoroacetyl-CoA thioesterase
MASDTSPGIAPGAEGRATMIVGASDTALSLRSGDVEVLGTPRLLALCEEAAVAAVSQMLTADKTSVGARAEIDHIAPSFTGAQIEAVARVVEVSGSKIVFEIEAKEGDTVVGRCKHTRVLVDRSRFDHK